MIRLCTCTGRSASSLQHPRHREASKVCKGCGGKLSVDGRGALPEIMLSTVGLELSGVIDPRLNWKTATKGRQRAVRRARTSFTSGASKISPASSSKNSEDTSEKETKRTEDMPVSESEKLGVSILGRRFSETLESVPIKKRRFLLVRSPSPPPQSPSQLDDSSSVLESKTETASFAKELAPGICSGIREESDQERIIANKITNLDINAKLCDSIDFSGISILAAAACDGNMGTEIVNTGDSVSEGHHPEGEQLIENSLTADSHTLYEGKGEKLCTFDKVDDMNQLPSKISTTSVSPTEGSDESKAHSFKNQEESKSSSPSSPMKTRRLVSSSRDDRFHWDLNTVMDAWECNSDEVKDSEPASAHIVDDKFIGDKHMATAEPCYIQQGLGATALVSQLGCTIEDACKLDNSNMQDKLEIYGDSSNADHYEDKGCGSIHDGNELAHEKHHLEDPALTALDAAEEPEKPSNQENASLAAEGIFSLNGAQGPVMDNISVNASVVDEKADGEVLSSGSNFVAEVSSPLLVFCANASLGHNIQICKPDPLGDQNQSDVVPEANECVVSMANLNKGIDDCCPTDDSMEDTHLHCPRDENLVSHFPVHPGTGGIAQSVAIGQSAGDCFDAPVGVDVGTGLSVSHVFANELADRHELSCGSADMEIEDTNCDQMVDGDLNAAKPDFSVLCGSKGLVGETASKNTKMVDTPLLGSWSSKGLRKSYADGYCSAEVASRDHFDCDNDSDASQTDVDQTVRMEKIEVLGDDDSQYEDGEFRESILNSWVEEGETEHLDYGSDYRETDAFDTSSDFPASVSLQPEIAEDKNGLLSDTGYNGCDGEQMATNVTQNAVSHSFMRCPSASDASSGKKGVESILNNFSGRQLTAKGETKSVDGAVEDSSEVKGLTDVNIENGGADLRMKFSGWDQLPKACNIPAVGMMDPRVDSANRDCSAGSLDTSNAVDSVGRAAGSLRRDLSSRVEKPTLSDGSCLNDKSFAGISRGGSRDVNTKAGRDNDSQRSIGRDLPSLHLQGRGRGDHWGDSYNHWGPSRHESPAYYGSASFRHHGSSNAAAAAVAKVESNGFVVASDGTLVKPGGVGPSARMGRRFANASSQGSHRTIVGSRSPVERDRAFGLPPALRAAREMSPDRHINTGRSRAIRYGSRMVNTDHRERYPRQTIGDSINSSPSVHHPLSRRDHSFSPRRRHLHLSRSVTKSPSRSRTRSPVMWASPRNRSNNKMDGSPGLRRRSRSPNFRPEGRLVRMRSPHRQPAFIERMVDYSSSSRDYSSPQRASRWVNDRKNMPDQYREHEYKQSSDRRSPTRSFSRNHRFDPMDPPRRLKLDGYYRPSNSGRFAEVGTDRGSRHDDGDDRARFDRHEMYHSVRQYGHGGSMKQFSVDGEDVFRANNRTAKIPSEFERRGSSRGFDGGIDRQVGGSPQRVREEKDHFRYRQNGNNNDNIKLFDVGNCEDDAAPLKRRPS